MQGEVVRIVRKRLGLTQEQFARMLDITVSTVNRWENGHSDPNKPTRAVIRKVAEECGINLDAVMSEWLAGRVPKLAAVS